MDKRIPIRQKVQRIVMQLCIAALLVTGIVSIICELSIRSNVLQSNQDLGETAAQTGGSALLDQMEKNLLRAVKSKAALADSELGRYAGKIGIIASYIEELYTAPEAYMPHPVLPPDPRNQHIYSMQRLLTSDQIDLSDISDELALLGNLEQVWYPVISADKEMITTIYIGTESGFMISFDDRADLAELENGESYFDYTDSSWYTSARDAGGIIFTDVYDDSYGRGLTITCAASFYNDGKFAGVVGMDILVDDMNRMIIDVDFSAGSYAFLVDRSGAVIASPDEGGSASFLSIYDTGTPMSQVADSVMSGVTDVVSSDATYYGFTPIATANWFLVVSVPESDIVAPAESIRQQIATKTSSTAEAMQQNIIVAIVAFLGIFAVTMAAVVYFTRRFARQLTDPLLALRQDVARISGGNLDYRAQVRSNDEIGDLAESFNSMAKSLDQYIHDLTSVTAEKERIGAELNVATQIQADMLPRIFPAFPGRKEFDIFASMDPAKEVGGDFYDFFLTDDDHLAIVVADVSGKGVPAALFMVIAKTLIKNHAQFNATAPGTVFTQTNDQLCEGNDAGLFVTGWMGILEISTGKFTYVNAGHNPPLLKRAGGTFEWLKSRPGFVLAGMEGVRYRENSLELAPGDQIFLYTDGVTEATNANEELFGEERLQAALNERPDLPVKELLPFIRTHIDGFVGEAEQFDDITMLSMLYKGKEGGNENDD